MATESPTRERSKGEDRSWRGRVSSEVAVCLTSAELWQRGFVVSFTNRNVPDVDLLAASDRGRGRPVSIQVKANGPEYGYQKWWTLSAKRPPASPDHYFVFVNLKTEWGRPDFYVVPTKVVAKNRGRPKRWGPWFPRDETRLSTYRDHWEILRRKPRKA